MDNVWTEADEEKWINLVTSDAATDGWYAGISEYNFATGEAKAPAVVKRYTKYQQFTKMMWKGASKVGFATDGQGNVVGRYCKIDLPSWSGTAAYTKIKANVSPVCIDSTGYNKCYNEMALRAHNDAREKLEGYKPLVLDKAMAQVLQQQLAKQGFAGATAPADRGSYASCAENVFVQTNKKKLSDVYLTNAATTAWFKGRYNYDFDKGAPKANASAPKKALSVQFVRMVWQTTTRVAFGVKDEYVVAWYCAAADPSNAV